MLTSLNRTLSVVVVALCLPQSLAVADAPATKYFDGAAREIVSSLEAGNGWALVSDRQNMQVDAAFPEALDCVRYQAVKKYQSGTTSNGQFYVELELTDATPWIFTSLKMPTFSGPSLTAAKAANEVIAQIDQTLPLFETAAAAEENPEVRALGDKVIGIYRAQRSALVDLIQKDVESIAR